MEKGLTVARYEVIKGKSKVGEIGWSVCDGTFSGFPEMVVYCKIGGLVTRRFSNSDWHNLLHVELQTSKRTEGRYPYGLFLLDLECQGARGDCC
jgi:hypothetical protein